MIFAGGSFFGVVKYRLLAPTWLLLRRDKTARQRSGDCSSCGTRGHWPTVSDRETNVSRNSIKHRIFSSSLLLGEENAKLYHSLLNLKDLIESLEPQGTLELLL